MLGTGYQKYDGMGEGGWAGEFSVCMIFFFAHLEEHAAFFFAFSYVQFLSPQSRSNKRYSSSRLLAVGLSLEFLSSNTLSLTGKENGSRRIGTRRAVREKKNLVSPQSLSYKPRCFANVCAGMRTRRILKKGGLLAVYSSSKEQWKSNALEFSMDRLVTTVTLSEDHSPFDL